MSQIAIRPMEGADKSFIFSSWLRCYREAQPLNVRLPQAVYFATQHDLVEELIGRATVTIAHPTGDPGTIVGYLVLERAPRPVIHWGYVKQAFRRMGIFGELVSASGTTLGRCDISHWTATIGELIQSHDGLRYNPLTAGRRDGDKRNAEGAAGQLRQG